MNLSLLCLFGVVGVTLGAPPSYLKQVEDLVLALKALPKDGILDGKFSDIGQYPLVADRNLILNFLEGLYRWHYALVPLSPWGRKELGRLIYGNDSTLIIPAGAPPPCLDMTDEQNRKRWGQWLRLFGEAPGPYWDTLTVKPLDDLVTVYTCNDFDSDDLNMTGRLNDAGQALTEYYQQEEDKRRPLSDDGGACFPSEEYPELGDLRPMKQVEDLLKHLGTTSSIDGDISDIQKYPVIHKPALVHVLNNCIRLQLSRAVKLSPQSKKSLYQLMLKPTDKTHPPCKYGVTKREYQDWMDHYQQSSNVLYESQWVDLIKNTGDLSGLYKFEAYEDEEALQKETTEAEEHPELQNSLGLGADSKSPLEQVFDLFKGLQKDDILTIKDFPAEKYPILHEDSPLKLECYYKLRFMIPLMNPKGMTYLIDKLLPTAVLQEPPCMNPGRMLVLASWVTGLRGVGTETTIKRSHELIEARAKELYCLAYKDETDAPSCNIYSFKKDDALPDEITTMVRRYQEVQQEKCISQRGELVHQTVPKDSPRIIDLLIDLIAHLNGGHDVTDPRFSKLHLEENAPIIVEALRRLRTRVAALSGAHRANLFALPLFTDPAHQNAAEDAKGNFFEHTTFPRQKAIYDRWVHLLFGDTANLWSRKDLSYAFPDLGGYTTDHLVSDREEEALSDEIKRASAVIYGDQKPIIQAHAVLGRLLMGAASFDAARTDVGNPPLFADFVDGDEGKARFAVMMEALRRLRIFFPIMAPSKARSLVLWVKAQRAKLTNADPMKFVIPCMNGEQLGQPGLAGSFLDFLERFDGPEETPLDTTIIGDADHIPYFPSPDNDPLLAMYHPEHDLCEIFDSGNLELDRKVVETYQGFYASKAKQSPLLPTDYDFHHYPVLMDYPMDTVNSLIEDLYYKDDGSFDFKDNYGEMEHPLLYNANLAPIFAECLRLQRAWVLEILKRPKTSVARKFLKGLPLLSRKIADKFLYAEKVPGITDPEHLKKLHLWISFIEEPTTLTDRLVATKFDELPTVIIDPWYMHGFTYAAEHQKDLKTLKKKIRDEDRKRKATKTEAETISDGDLLIKYRKVEKLLKTRRDEAQNALTKIDKGFMELQADLGLKLQQHTKGNKAKLKTISKVRKTTFKIAPKKKADKKALTASRQKHLDKIVQVDKDLKANVKKLQDDLGKRQKKLTKAMDEHKNATARFDAVRKALETTRQKTKKNDAKAVKKAIEDANKTLQKLEKELATQEQNVRTLWRARIRMEIKQAEAEIKAQHSILDEAIELHKLATEKKIRDKYQVDYVQPALAALTKALNDLDAIHKLPSCPEGVAFKKLLDAELKEIKATKTVAEGHIKELEKIVKKAKAITTTIKGENDEVRDFATYIKKSLRKQKHKVEDTKKLFKKVVRETLHVLGIQIMGEKELKALTKTKTKHEKLGKKTVRKLSKTRAKKRRASLKAAKKTAADEEAIRMSISMAAGNRESNPRERTGINYQHVGGPPRPGAGPGTVVSKPVSTWKAEALGDINGLRSRDPAHLAQLSSSDYKGIPFKSALTAEDMARLPPTFLSAFTLTDAGELDLNAIPATAWKNFGEEVPSGPTHPAHLIDATTLSKLKIDIIKSLTPKFIANLESSAMSGIDGTKFTVLSGEQLVGMSRAHVQNLEMSVWSSLTDQVVPRMGSNFALNDPAHPRYQMDKTYLKAVPASTRKAIYQYWFNGSSMEYGRALYGWGIIGLFVAPFVF